VYKRTTENSTDRVFLQGV